MTSRSETQVLSAGDVEQLAHELLHNILRECDCLLLIESHELLRLELMQSEVTAAELRASLTIADQDLAGAREDADEQAAKLAESERGAANLQASFASVNETIAELRAAVLLYADAIQCEGDESSALDEMVRLAEGEP